ncbi:hypothetical protein M408DRAFT_305886 [Serendipita vermifera MAFF 305830]|uniref:Wax synthase domain-containing protein n=1 Tax=Serendipita vermifera MAFF 305830 TaxID=933852 RepID=A0A0C3A8J8_SERVB|nr:hypothetical protein M408DRAFT_305886 [Serendipita vermifera MAFF 305830]
MLILLLAYAITQSVYSDAGPIPASIQLRDVASCDGLNGQRSIWSIVWSCLSTIFLCTWVAVHPNVHFRPEKWNQSWFEKWLWDPLHDFFTYKLILFLWALLVPEYILAWAVRQWLKAGEISKKVPEWTRTHGFFIIMGGFHLFRLPADAPSTQFPPSTPFPRPPNHPRPYSFLSKPSESSDFVVPTGLHSRKDEVPVCPLKLEDFTADLLKTIAPTETELKDRGKSDVLTKFIVLVQTMWFVIQCIVRGTQHLPLTELEVVTLAYTMLNFFIYIFWWDKPRNVECPIRVYKTSMSTHKESGEEADEWDDTWWIRWVQPILYYTIGNQDDCVTLSKQRSIPMFWSGRMEQEELGLAGLGPSILGAAFGAIHCIAWSSEFPSHAELILWRIACISIIIVPFLAAMLCAYLSVDEAGTWYEGLLIATGVFSMFILALSAWLYVAARIATLVIAFSSLRSLPPPAFTTVDWTTFIPHI